MMTFLRVLSEDGSSFPSLAALIKYMWLFIEQVTESCVCSLRGRLKSFVPKPTGSALPWMVTCPPSMPLLPPAWPAFLGWTPALLSRAHWGRDGRSVFFSSLPFLVKSIRDTLQFVHRFGFGQHGNYAQRAS